MPGVNFAAGTHTFAIKYVAVGSNGNAGNVFIFYDCFEIVPKNAEIGEATLEVSSNKMACGSTMAAESELYYTTGYICNDELIESVSYESSNTNVATVDEDGAVYAAGIGTATITAKTADGAVSATCKVTVSYSTIQWIIVYLLFGWIWYI